MPDSYDNLKNSFIKTIKEEIRLDNVKERTEQREEEIYKEMLLNERRANINRIFYILSNRDCAFLSAFRSDKTHKENYRRNKKLANKIRTLDLSYIKIKGGSIEKVDDSEEKNVEEDSFIIINSNERLSKEEFFDVMIGLCNEFDQDTILISFCDGKGEYEANLYRKDGTIDGKPKHDITTQDIEKYFSKIHGHEFTLKDIKEATLIPVEKKSLSSLYPFYNEVRALSQWKKRKIKDKE